MGASISVDVAPVSKNNFCVIKIFVDEAMAAGVVRVAGPCYNTSNAYTTDSTSWHNDDLLLE